MSGSNDFRGSQSFSGSRPFLNMLNPMSRQHQGYTPANQLLEEAEEEEAESAEQGMLESIPLSKSRPGTSRRSSRTVTADLHPNIRKSGQDSSEEDDEVPQSFMIEASSRRHSSASKGKAKANPRTRPLHATPPSRPSAPILPTHMSVPPRPSDIDPDPPEHEPRQSQYQPPKPMRGLDAYERALWNWVNVYNLDSFLQEVYFYYEGKGIYSIALSRGLNLLTVGFVIGFSTFLLGCIDYSKIQPERKLSDVIVDRCVSRFSGLTFLLFMLFTAFYVWEIVSFVLDVRRLIDMYNFYTHLLKIPDVDIQTISWPEIVRRIGSIREDNPMTAISSRSARNTNDTTSAKLDAHDIANRIMRQENYLIALFNKDLLDLRVPVPQFLEGFVSGEEGKGKRLTRALEWNLRFCLMEYLFDQHGRVRKVFLKSKNRNTLVEGLRRRFIFMGVLNAIFAPFIVLYLLMYSFFRYFEEYHKNPSSIGGRRYTSFAQWKFREFNELPHFFVRRLDESYPYASMYIGQFPNENLTIIMRFVAFIAGSFAGVLFLATILDPDIFIHFEITPHKTVLFYLGVFGSVLAVARGMIPEDNRVFDPEMLMTEVINYSHYMPDKWKDQLHSKKVHQEFGELFQMKILIFLEEILSVVLTPFVLWFTLPKCTPAIIDFFREFSVHVDGRGYVCSFAEFNFERHGNVKFGAPAPVADKRMVSNDGKMEKSFLNFKVANPDWKPSDPSGSLFLSRMADLNAGRASPHRRRPSQNMEGTIHAERKPDASGNLQDRAHEYDRALKQSQVVAARRRGGLGASVLGMSTLQQPQLSASSVFGGGAAMAQTAVLGDSQGSVFPLTRPLSTSDIPEEDLEGVGGSGLGGSYVDGAKRTKPIEIEEEEEEDGLEDGGVLGLLAQIYSGRTRDGPQRAMQ